MCGLVMATARTAPAFPDRSMRNTCEHLQNEPVALGPTADSQTRARNVNPRADAPEKERGGPDSRHRGARAPREWPWVARRRMIRLCQVSGLMQRDAVELEVVPI